MPLRAGCVRHDEQAIGRTRGSLGPAGTLSRRRTNLHNSLILLRGLDLYGRGGRGSDCVYFLLGHLHMSMHIELSVPAAGLKSEADQALEGLLGTFIAAYEKALEQGLTPTTALGAVLSWTAEEIARLHETSLQSRGHAA